MNFLETAPEAGNVLKCAHGNDRAESALGERQRFHVRDLIHPWSRSRVHAEITLTRKERPKVRNLFLAGHFIRADFENRSREIESFGDSASHAVQKKIHARASLHFVAVC